MTKRPPKNKWTVDQVAKQLLEDKGCSSCSYEKFCAKNDGEKHVWTCEEWHYEKDMVFAMDPPKDAIFYIKPIYANEKKE